MNKIFFIVKKFSYDNPGAEKAQYLIAKYFSTQPDWDVTIYCNTIDSKEIDFLNSNDVKLIVEGQHYFSRLFFELLLNKNIIFFSWYWKYNFIYYLPVLFTNSTSICFNHGFVERELDILNLHGIVRKLMSFSYRFTMKKICKIIFVPSHDLKNELDSAIKLDTSKVFVQYFELPDTRININNIELMSRKEVLFVGGFNKYKGVYKLLEAAQTNLDYIFYIYGNTKTEWSDDVLLQIKQKKIKNIRLMGVFKNEDKVYSKYPILYYPSLLDNLPLAIIEAFMNGMVIYSTDVGEIKHLIQNGNNGFIIDQDKIYSNLNNVEISLKSRETYMRLFAIGTSFDKLNILLKELKSNYK